MGVFLLQGEHRRGQGVHRPGQSVARAPSTGGRLLEIRARDELYRKTSVRCSGVSPLRIERLHRPNQAMNSIAPLRNHFVVIVAAPCSELSFSRSAKVRPIGVISQEKPLWPSI